MSRVFENGVPVGTRSKTDDRNTAERILDVGEQLAWWHYPDTEYLTRGRTTASQSEKAERAVTSKAGRTRGCEAGGTVQQRSRLHVSRWAVAAAIATTLAATVLVDTFPVVARAQATAGRVTAVRKTSVSCDLQPALSSSAKHFRDYACDATGEKLAEHVASELEVLWGR